MKYDYKKLTPFKMQCLTNFPFIDEDFDALSNYGLLCKIVEYLNNISSNNNLLVDNINALNNWFNNLDVQDEINNKLDAMAETGELQEIISIYLNSKAIFGYDNVEDMKTAQNLLNGSYAKTLGFYLKNDGGSSVYKIRNITNDDVVDNMTIIAMDNQTLVAELIIDNILNIKQLGAKLDGINDDSSYLNKALEISNNVILPKESTILINNIDIPSNKTVDFNYSTVKTSGVAIKESSIDETSGYNYRKNIIVKNVNFDLLSNQKGISLINTIETTIENITTSKNVPSNSYVIYVNNSFNITFKDIYINGNSNSFNNNSYGIYVLASDGGIAGTNNITNLNFVNCLIQRVANGIIFDKSGNGVFDTVKLTNIGFSWCDKPVFITDNLGTNSFKNIFIDTMRAELSNYGIYVNGFITLSNFHAYNCGYGIYNKGRLICNGFIEIVGTVDVEAIYNSGYLDLTNSVCAMSSSYAYDLGSSCLKSQSQNLVSSNSSSMSWLNDHPEPINYNCDFTGTEIFYLTLKTPINNTIIEVFHANDIKLYVATGTYYDIKSYDSLILKYMNNKWYILTSAKLITP